MRKTARKYDKVIQIFGKTKVSDGYGGFTVSEDITGTPAYCSIKTLNAQRVTDLGLNTNTLAIEIELRNNTNIDYNVKDLVIKYKGISYTINTIENKDVNGLYLRITATASQNANQSFTV